MNGVNHENGGGGGGRVTSKTAPARLEQLDSEDDEDNILFKVLTNPTFPSALFCMHDNLFYNLLLFVNISYTHLCLIIRHRSFYLFVEFFFLNLLFLFVHIFFDVKSMHFVINMQLRILFI